MRRGTTQITGRDDSDHPPTIEYDGTTFSGRGHPSAHRDETLFCAVVHLPAASTACARPALCHPRRQRASERPYTSVSDHEALAVGTFEYGTGRVEAFSDGVMAVIITIMAFELKTPATATLSSLSHRLPTLLAYILSFSFVGIYWNNHHHLFRATKRINGAVMWANLHLLFWLSLIPFLTQWVGTQYRHPLPAASYGVVSLFAALAYFVLVRTIIRADDPGSFVSRAIGSDFKGNVSILIYAAAIPLSLVSPWISYVMFASVSVMWFIPDRRFSRYSDT